MKKNLLFLVMALVLSMGILAGCSTTKSSNTTTTTSSSNSNNSGASPAAKKQESKEPYKIGVDTSVTGPIGWLGEATKKAIVVYAEEVNKKGGVNGHPIEMIFFDNESKPELAQQGAKKLIQQDKVALIIGGSSTPDTAAITQVSIPAKVPVLSLSGSWLPDPEKDWVWTTLHASIPGIKQQFEFMKNNNIKKIAYIYSNDALGQIVKPMNVAVAATYPGIEIVGEQFINIQSLDVKAQLNILKSKNPEMIVAPISGEPMATLRKQLTEVGMNIPIMGPSSLAIPDLLKLMSNTKPGLMLGVTGKVSDYPSLKSDDPQKPIIDEFVEKYKAKYNTIPGYLEGAGYDAMKIAVAALEKCGTDGEKIKDFVNNLKNFPGVSGVFNYDAKKDRSGLGSDNLIIVEYRDNAWKKIEKLK